MDHPCQSSCDHHSFVLADVIWLGSSLGGTSSAGHRKEMFTVATYLETKLADDLFGQSIQ